MKDEALAQQEETLMEQNVRYTIELDGRLYVVENVPARVNIETGEQYFSPQTVERLHDIIRGREKPVRRGKQIPRGSAVVCG